jgi:hypothetical protein
MGLAIAALATVGAWLWWRSGIIPTTDATTLCPEGGSPSEVVAVLLDMSDELTEPQRLAVKNGLAVQIDAVTRFGLVEIFAVDKVADRVIAPVVHRCNPGSGTDMNRWYQNPDIAKRRWNEFHRELEAELTRLLSGQGASASPIMEAIQAIALRTFNPPKYRTLARRLVVVSDLLQHVPEYSQYDQASDFESFRTTPYFTKVRADLDGVKVSSLYLVRAPTPQPWPAHRLFWEKYFSVQGAVLETITPIYGAK